MKHSVPKGALQSQKKYVWKNVLKKRFECSFRGRIFHKNNVKKIIKKPWLEHVTFLQKWLFLALFEVPDLVNFWKSWLKKVRYLTLFEAPDLVYLNLREGNCTWWHGFWNPETVSGDREKQKQTVAISNKISTLLSGLHQDLQHFVVQQKQQLNLQRSRLVKWVFSKWDGE